MSARETTSDGRVARGDESRRRLLAATLTVMEQGGVAAVSHRAVAAEAGVAAASVRYHFGSIDDLLVAAMTTATEEWAATLAGHAPDTHLGRLAAFLADESLHHRERAVAEFELYLLAARRPALRPAALAWLGVAIGPLADGLDDVGRRTFAAVLDGICLHGLLADDPPDAATIEAVLRRVCETGG
ncbi:TetR/AcrR family transcriptional regulator [Patulibacter minatonensis]|uniref:TetR/AcrR family transcriptional regulator n=1 Tax=Patulibacter minatonensis TaxID=298163 RepID=UPI000478C0A7|nr:TetR family transcriptional regulator [Patulibacter minatonensis]